MVFKNPVEGSDKIASLQSLSTRTVNVRGRMKILAVLFHFGLVAVIFAYKIPDEHEREKRLFLAEGKWSLFFSFVIVRVIDKK